MKLSLLVFSVCLVPVTEGLAFGASRRSALQWLGSAYSGLATLQPALAESTPESLDVDNFIRTGVVANPMGVSGQAGKSRPETGVILGNTEVSRDSRTGNVFAEILLDTTDGKSPYVASYSSPWPLAKGTVFDIECRDAKTGDGAFVSVTTSTGGKSSMSELKDSFFVDQLFSPTGRFSFYGPPTDVKLQKSIREGDKMTMDLSFSTVSQATQTEIPRKARLVATIPTGSNQAVMLVASASANRWKKNDVEKGVSQAIDSFRVAPAPKTTLKTRGKERRD